MGEKMDQDVNFLTFGRFFSLIGLPVYLFCVAFRSLFSLSLHAFYEKRFCRRVAPAFMMESQGQRDMRFRKVCSEFRANLFSVSMKRDEALGANLFWVSMKRDEALGLNLFSVWVKCAASLS